ncbi:transcription antitermination factor NusB [Roseibacillus ishigakijimensis]|uniref:Transcription antitermination factor NusB n=1 Tax=Roseibacillus ishigakijimensis TaxID=454146 RepID=A0A934RRE5_9BACT|nr:transcription antitermination factor NusB [Roseibacillus ishigakijimensis]MBK1834073.1 transcription antitermination factor NusB [Roseibacillus ishigakijimensis]
MKNTSPSPSTARRQIREAVVQLLHADRPSPDGEEAALAGDPWPLILAPFEGKVIRARARVVLHLQQNRAGRLQPVWKQRVQAPPLLESFLDDRSANRGFRQLLAAEQKLPDCFDLLRRQLKSEKEPETIAENLEDIRATNEESRHNGQALITALGPVDACPELLRPLAKALPPLVKSASLLHTLFTENLPDIPETKTLRECIKTREEIKGAAQARHQLVLANLAETDKLITAQLENFSFQRLAQVDRAVLRLAVTEIQHCPEIPAAVSINEAVELARRYSGTDSASFVNGVLGKLQ